MRLLAVITILAFVLAALGAALVVVGVIVSAMELSRIGLWMCAGGVLVVVAAGALACCIAGKESEELEDWRE